MQHGVGTIKKGQANCKRELCRTGQPTPHYRDRTPGVDLGSLGSTVL